MNRTTSLRAIRSALAAGLLLSGATTWAQPSISGVFPDGAFLMQPTGYLTFTANSTVGIDAANISVQATISTLGGNITAKNYTSANGLALTGSTASWSVSLPLITNRLYSATITVKDANGAQTTATTAFTTLAAYTFEAEDYDYTAATAGLFFDNPQTNAYATLSATPGVDFQHDQTSGPGANAYRPRPSGLALEGAGDKTRLPYANGQSDSDVGWNNGGDWANYTRDYPAGTYYVYLRGADGNSAQADAASMSVVSGTATLAGSAPFSFDVPGQGWQTYNWCQLKDSAGSPVTLTCDGTPSTLQVHVDNGNFNANFYMLLPVETNAPSALSLTNVYPDGQALYQSASALSFTVTAGTAIDPAGISVQMTATNLWGQGSSPVLTVGNGLTASGPPTNLTITAPLATNTIYNVIITASDANGNAAATNVSFDTIIPAYSFEAEDYDYNGGAFIDNPQTNAYANLTGLEGIDTHSGNPLLGAWAYRNQSYLSGGIETEFCNDKPRAPYAGGLQEYDCGFANGGNWANYTRTYPTGTFNIFMRAANGNGLQSDGASLSLVTGGLGTTNQPLVKLGTFAIPNSGGWQTYLWVPLKDVKGNLVQITGGSVKTLRITTDNGSYNANFYLLNPADPAVRPVPTADNFQPDGTHLFQYTNLLTFLAHSSPGIATSNISVTLNGAKVDPSQLTFSGSPNLWSVTCPLAYNSYYTAVISMTDANGTAFVTNAVATFAATNYQWEAEDYDYNGGQYFDNPQVDQYSALAGTLNVDSFENDPNAIGRGFNYRPMLAQDFPDGGSGDEARSQFTAAGATDYSIGSFGGGSFANYTRHYPAGTYIVMGRFAEGANNTEATLSKLTAGYGTTAQTAQLYGTFYIPPQGWGTWEWAPLLDSQGRLAKVTVDDSLVTFQLGGSPVSGQPEANVNFFMLVPTMADVWLSAAANAGSVHVSFSTQNGYTYQLQYKNQLSDPAWSNVGGAVSGNNHMQSVSDAPGAPQRFYRVQVQ